jgi:hypothetical protein
MHLAAYMQQRLRVTIRLLLLLLLLLPLFLCVTGALRQCLVTKYNASYDIPHTSWNVCCPMCSSIFWLTIMMAWRLCVYGTSCLQINM